MTDADAQLSTLVPICSRLPRASVDQLIGATRIIARGGARVNQRKLAAALKFDDEQTVGVIEFLSRLGLVEAIASEVALTEVGKRIASSHIAVRKQLFAELVMRLPVIRKVVEILAREPGRSVSHDRLLDDLGAEACPSDAESVLDHVVAWGRYAGLFSYDKESEQVHLL